MRGTYERSTVILGTATGLLLPLLLLFSVFLLIRGHNLPGGGFVGGLAASAAIGLYALAFDVPSARRMVRFHPLEFLGSGILIAAASGLLALFFRLPYMTGQWTTFEIVAIGKLGTPLMFDIGVYLVVIGTVLMIIFELAED